MKRNSETRNVVTNLVPRAEVAVAMLERVGSWPSKLGSGKVAGKVLIVDHM